jgi:hypothetical protein
MKTKAVQTASAMLAALIILFANGCNDRQVTSSQVAQNVNTKEDQALKELEMKVGISFPANTVLVNSTDGGGRDSSYGFYAWGLFSPTAIKMPPMKAPGVTDYLNLPLDDTVKFVQGMMRNRKISQPQSAFSSEWETNSYTFRGTLVRSPHGDHLVIEQFLKK